MRVATLCMALACLGSFGWAMRYFFKRPHGPTRMMRLTSLVGTICAVSQLGVIWLAGVSIPWVWLGWGCYVISLIVFYWAVAVNRQRPLSWAYSTDTPLHLQVAGPYRFVRHPFYLAYLLTFVGGALATANGWLLLTVVAMGLGAIRAARMEEAKFESSPLAADYLEYRLRAGMFWPRIGRLLHFGRESL